MRYKQRSTKLRQNFISREICADPVIPRVIIVDAVNKRTKIPTNDKRVIDNVKWVHIFQFALLASDKNGKNEKYTASDVISRGLKSLTAVPFEPSSIGKWLSH